MLLNKYAGRSYLDPANYPVFPWIIDSYDAEKYGYRDLSKSMGALVSDLLFRATSKEEITLRPKLKPLIPLIQFLHINLEPIIVRQEWSSIS